MSEYQFVHFLAVDRPLDDEQLEYMQTQSSRAEISRWEFTNEYHFGDFRGNAHEMLRRGFDVHLHYANFGIRRLMVRLPQGLPIDKKLFRKLYQQDGLTWHADKTGAGGSLEIQPDADAGSYDDVLNVSEMLPEIAPVREMLMSGDLRPFYLAWLACVGDEEAIEPPVPAGLQKLPEPLVALAALYELSRDLIAAAAQRSPPAPAPRDELKAVTAWVAQQSVGELRSLVPQLLSKSAADVRTKTLTIIRGSVPAMDWPVAAPSRTIGELRELEAQLASEWRRKKEETALATRKRRLAKMAAHPDEAIAEAERLIATGSRVNYDRAAQELADLCLALGPERGRALVQRAATAMRKKHPQRRGLTAAFKKHDLLPKTK